MSFVALKEKIEHATKKAFIEIFQQRGAEEIYSFALYSDESAMTVCPSTNVLSHLLTADQDQLAYYKFEPAEWKYKRQGASEDFNAICECLRGELEEGEKGDDAEAWHSAFQQKLFETCIEVLEQLKNENFFKKIIGRDIFLTFVVSDYEFEKNEARSIITRLNDNVYKDEFLSWMTTWPWIHESKIKTSASPDRIWALFSDIMGWKRWNAGIETIQMQEDFIKGSHFTMQPTGQEDTFSFTLIEVEPNKYFTDETTIGETCVQVKHELLQSIDGGTIIAYRAKVTGPEAEFFGPIVTNDFPDVLAALKNLAEQ